jgi:hypothetical protein
LIEDIIKYKIYNLSISYSDEQINNYKNILNNYTTDELRRIKLIEEIVEYKIAWIKIYNSSISYSDEQINDYKNILNNYTTPKLKETLANYVYKLSKLFEYENRFI